MFILGITGSIGSGKSHFCKKISTIRGAKTFSSDEMVHKLYEDKNFVQILTKKFGEEIFKNGKINRKLLGDIVFNDSKKKEELEKLVYPELKKFRQEIIKKLNRQNFRGILVFEIPLLFENNLEEECDAVLTVFCSPIIQKQRVLKRQNMDENKYRKILNSQMSINDKIKLSDFIFNSGDISQSIIRSFRLIELYKA